MHEEAVTPQPSPGASLLHFCFCHCWWWNARGLSYTSRQCLQQCYCNNGQAKAICNTNFISQLRSTDFTCWKWTLRMRKVPHPGPPALWQGKGQQWLRVLNILPPWASLEGKSFPIKVTIVYSIVQKKPVVRNKRNKKLIHGEYSLVFPRTLFWESQYGFF